MQLPISACLSKLYTNNTLLYFVISFKIQGLGVKILHAYAL